MSTDRIPCSKCGAFILEVTAKLNAGLCAPCKSEYDAALKSQRIQEARRNAPLPPINYASFSRKQFVDGLAKVCLPHREDTVKVSEEFLGFCEPILQRRSRLLFLDVIFDRWQLFRNLKRIPRPFREVMAVYQAWGMVISDGFESYVQNTNRKFDTEVERGLATLGQTVAISVIPTARRVYRSNDGEIPPEMDKALWNKFYGSMPDFESKILGAFLIQELTVAESFEVANPNAS